MIYRGLVIFIVHVDDGMFSGKTECQLSNIVKELQNIGLDIEDQGHPVDYVGLNKQKHDDGPYEFTQCALIDSVIEDVGLSYTKAATKPIPAAVQKPLHAFKDFPSFRNDFNYCSVVGKLNYIAQTTWPNIIYSMHQCAHFSFDHHQVHGEANLYLVMCLLKAHHLGIKFAPDKTKGFKCYVDADFCGNWEKGFASSEFSTAKSWSGWIVCYANCFVSWASKIQTWVALSTTEAEYNAMLSSLRDVIPMMEMVAEIRNHNIQVTCDAPHVFCNVFEDNAGALELSWLPKLHPCMKQCILSPFL